MRVTKADRTALRQSAAVLSSYARGIFESEMERGDSNPNKGKVLDEVVLREIAEFRELAAHLRAMAKRKK